jgi:3-hydroxypropanoate dehydrogenase
LLPESRRLDSAVLDQLYHKARTHNAFLDKEVPDALLNEAVELTVQGPTAANTLPFRVVKKQSHRRMNRFAL